MQVKNLPDIITKSKVVPADKDWEFITKFTLIVNDILYGNPKLAELGWHEEALGKNAIVGGFKVKDTGQIGCLTLILQRQLWHRHSTGTVKKCLLRLQPKMIH